MFRTTAAFMAAAFAPALADSGRQLVVLELPGLLRAHPLEWSKRGE